jgi:hypothetical protein
VPMLCKDEGRSLEAGCRGHAPNHRKLQRSRAVMVGVAEKEGRDPVRYDFREASASKPLMTCRKRNGDIEIGGTSLTRKESGVS